MAVKKGGLGKGLDSLIPSGAPKNKKNITEEKKQPVKVVEKVVEKIVEKPVEMKMKITEVEPNREQPRKNFDEDALLELAESIKQFGVLQPLLVQKMDDYYEIIAGERRWRAAKLAGLKEVPVIIKDFSDQSASSSFESFDISSPSTYIFPSVGLSSPPSRFRSVLFPAPLGPRITTNFPSSSSIFTESRALSSWSPLL